MVSGSRLDSPAATCQLSWFEHVLPGLEDDWLRLDGKTKDQLLLLDKGAAWLSTEHLTHKDARDNQDDQHCTLQTSLQAENLLGSGISYRALRDSPCYNGPSTLRESKQISEGDAFVGYPSCHHWIRLAGSEADTDFISHWVFQDPTNPILETNWCRVKVSQSPSGVLHLSWAGLAVPAQSNICYCLEWSKRGAETAAGSGLTPRPDAWHSLMLCVCL